MNPIEDVWNIMKKEISNQNQCKRKICRSEYVKRGIVLHGTFWKSFYNSMLRKIADLIKAKQVQINSGVEV